MNNNPKVKGQPRHINLHVIDKNEYCHKLAIFKSFIISQE